MMNAVILRPETNLGITTYWLVVDGDNVGTIHPLGRHAPKFAADYWVLRIEFPVMAPDWFKDFWR